jgi:hypothetical protein
LRDASKAETEIYDAQGPLSDLGLTTDSARKTGAALWRLKLI